MVEIGPDVAGYWDWLRWHGATITLHEGKPHVRFEIPCQKLVKGKCTVYEERPPLCKAYLCDRARRHQ